MDLYDVMRTTPAVREFTGDPWLDHGIGYVLFAGEEWSLFLGLNDEAHFVIGRQYGQRIWDDCTTALTAYPAFEGLSEEQVFNVQLKRWMLAHGFAFHVCFAPKGTVGLDKIILHISEGSIAILEGLKNQFTGAPVRLQPAAAADSPRCDAALKRG